MKMIYWINLKVYLIFSDASKRIIIIVSQICLLKVLSFGS